jgi:hypothetical protein
MTTQILLFNGPPASGKDTAVDYLHEHSGGWKEVHKLKFADPIDRGIQGMLSLSSGYTHRWNKLRHDPDLKNTEAFLNTSGKTAREIMVGFSEQFAKPLLGQGIFGQLAAKRIPEPRNYYHPTLYLISDCGFQVEYNTFTRLVADRAKVHLINIHRDGCTFANDSREYVQPNPLTKSHHTITNNGSKAEFEHTVLNLLNQIRAQHT